MIVAEDDDRYRLVTQPDHSRQVGRIARHWGNDRVDAPEPRLPCVVAAEAHDNGWWEYDLQPHLVDGKPAGILDPDSETWTEFYRRGPERVADMDPYAGVLVSMHGTGVKQQRYGWSESVPDKSEAFGAFIDDQEQFQRDRMAEMADTERFGAYATAAERDGLATIQAGDAHEFGADPPRIWTNYRLLQTWDMLSLYCCRSNSLSASRITGVPGGPDGETTTLSLEPTDERTVRIDPYPFDTAPLSVPVEGRLLDKPVATESNLFDAYYQADPVEFEFVFER
jgi:hypothetical protein